MSTDSQPFLTDVKELRGAPASTSRAAWSRAPIRAMSSRRSRYCRPCWPPRSSACLRYTMHAVAATGISSDGVKEEFAEHAREEQEHAHAGRRADQPAGRHAELQSRRAGHRVRRPNTWKAANLVEMIKENLIAERIAVDHYRELIRYFGDKDPTTRVMMEGILANEEEHANDMHDLLVAHEGRPFLKP